MYSLTYLLTYLLNYNDDDDDDEIAKCCMFHRPLSRGRGQKQSRRRERHYLKHDLPKYDNGRPSM